MFPFWAGCRCSTTIVRPLNQSMTERCCPQTSALFEAAQGFRGSLRRSAHNMVTGQPRATALPSLMLPSEARCMWLMLGAGRAVCRVAGCDGRTLQDPGIPLTVKDE